jgi:hypothetical protein
MSLLILRRCDVLRVSPLPKFGKTGQDIANQNHLPHQPRQHPHVLRASLNFYALFVSLICLDIQLGDVGLPSVFCPELTPATRTARRRPPSRASPR